MMCVDAYFGRKAQQQEEAQQYEIKRVSKLGGKSLSQNDRNNGSQAQKIINRPQRKQAGLEEPRERNSKPMGIIRDRKQARIVQRDPKQ